MTATRQRLTIARAAIYVSTAARAVLRGGEPRVFINASGLVCEFVLFIFDSTFNLFQLTVVLVVFVIEAATSFLDITTIRVREVAVHTSALSVEATSDGTSTATSTLVRTRVGALRRRSEIGPTGNSHRSHNRNETLGSRREVDSVRHNSSETRVEGRGHAVDTSPFRVSVEAVGAMALPAETAGYGCALVATRGVGVVRH